MIFNFSLGTTGCPKKSITQNYRFFLTKIQHQGFHLDYITRSIISFESFILKRKILVLPPWPLKKQLIEKLILAPC